MRTCARRQGLPWQASKSLPIAALDLAVADAAAQADFAAPRPKSSKPVDGGSAPARTDSDGPRISAIIPSLEIRFLVFRSREGCPAGSYLKFGTFV
jgi:hypothetical protein